MVESGPPDPAHTVLRTSLVLSELAHTGEGDTIMLSTVLERFHTRAYGVLLVIVLVPAFIPLPIGTGAISGPLVALTGLQMLLTLRQPWLPRRALGHEIRRATLKRFAERMHRFLGRLERACRPRLIWLTEGTLAHAFSGAQLILLGILLALPIPLTNYPFGLLLLLYAISIIERDGALLLVAWAIGCSTIIASLLLSSEVLELIQRIWT